MGAAPSHEPRRFARHERAAPDEIVVRILTYADDRTLRAAEVNKRWSRLTRTREPWRSALHSRFAGVAAAIGASDHGAEFESGSPGVNRPD